MSAHELTKEETSVLQKGLNFAPTQKSVPRTEIIAGVETALRSCAKINAEEAERTRASIAAIIRNAAPPKPNVTPGERLAMRALSQNKDIIIVPADKGNATVVLSTDDYEQKASDLLKRAPFQKLGKDPTARTERRVNDTLKRLAEKEEDSASTILTLRVPNKGSRPPLFYGSVKVHKPDFPLRPIVSSIGSATYKVSKHVSNILTTYAKQLPSYIQNTMHFMEELREEEITEEDIMVNFDVKSMFTSIPRKDALEAIREIIDADEDFMSRTGMTTDTSLELTKLCTITNFQFRADHYELSDGLAMGAPSSPAIANLYMGKLEEKAISTFDGPKPRFWRRYVDDVFAILKRSVLIKFLAHLNTQHPAIRFTVETESEKELPFLDLNVRRSDNILSTDVYRKPTHTGRYLDFRSNHPESAKRSVVRSLADRQQYITGGDYEKAKREAERVQGELASNGYPRSFVEQCIRRQPRRPAAEQEWCTTASLPYVPGVSEAIRRILAPLNIRTVSRPSPIKWMLMKGAKDKIPPAKDPGVIYAIGCTECNKVYIGETARTAEQRVKEHKAHLTHGRTEQSAIARHVVEENHGIHWEPRIIEREKNTTKRKVKEALSIRKVERRDGSMNQDSGLMMSKLWLDLVK